MEISSAIIADAEELLSLQRQAYQSEAEIYSDYNIPPLTQTLDELIQEFEHHIILKAVVSNKIVGSVRALVKDDTCCIGRLIVHPDYHNQGIGTQLMNEVENQCNQCIRFELFTGHLSVKNLYLYEKLGYKRFASKEINGALTLISLDKRVI
jgi:GNAT superfamily N-acetyltransferase